ncbi:MAG: transposase [Saprospiraceae bacterium]|nr:transposase [Saprospiraceae bacterium]
MPYARKDILAWQKGTYYHIYNRGVSKSTLFRESTNYLFVIDKIQKYRKQHNITVIAYCLMPNHYHLLVRQDGDQPAGNLPQSVFNSYSKAYNKKYAHSGTLFEGRFRAKPLKKNSHLLHLCRYIHGNPVKDGLVSDPADWGWSNYLDWVGERNGALVDRDFIQHQFGSASEYRKFIQQDLASRDLPEYVQKLLDEIER